MSAFGGRWRVDGSVVGNELVVRPDGGVGGGGSRGVVSRGGRVGVGLFAVVVACAVLGVLSGGSRVAAGRRSVVRAPVARLGLLRLPVAARAPISVVLGGELRAYRVRRAVGGGFVAWSVAQRLRVTFGGSGVSVTHGAARVSLSVRAYGAGGVLRRVRSAAPVLVGGRVVYGHGAVREWFANGPAGLEQGFDLAARPAGAGPLTLALGVGGSVRVRSDRGDAVIFDGAGSSLLYTGLRAIDARGRVLRARFVRRAGRILIRVDDRGARFPVRIDPLIQEGAKLVGGCTGGSCANQGMGEAGEGFFGFSVAMSADGNTALIGADGDNGGVGAVWVFTRSAGAWSQQGSKLVGDCTGGGCAQQGTGETGNGAFGSSVALSGDGTTALIGADGDNGGAGGVWVFTRSGGVWSQQGPELVGGCTAGGCANEGTGETANGGFGTSLALSSDGSTALVGAADDGGQVGAAWVFTRSGSAWVQQGAKLVGDCSTSCASQGTGETDNGEFGQSVALSADGSTALIGGAGDKRGAGAAWVFARTAGAWTEQGARLVGDCTSSCANEGTGETGEGGLGTSVSLSAAGSTAVVGAPDDGSFSGAAWVFARSGTAWSQQGAKLVGDCTTGCANEGTGETGAGKFGSSVALSGDGSTALIGGPVDAGGNGGAWRFTSSGSSWTQQGSELAGDCVSGCANEGTGETGDGQFGSSVALSSDGATELVGADQDNPAGDAGAAGAVWPFGPPRPAITGLSPVSGVFAGGTLVTITGTGFTGATSVDFGSAPATDVTVHGDTQVTALSPAGTGIVDVSVTTPGGTSPTTGADGYTYVSAASLPVVTSISPRSGPGAGGTLVTITGTGLTDATGVFFGSASASFFNKGPTELQAVAPPHTAGQFDVTVQNASGTSPLVGPDRYTYLLPVITSVTPDTGFEAGGTHIKIIGHDFTGATDVLFQPVIDIGPIRLGTHPVLTTPARASNTHASGIPPKPVPGSPSLRGLPGVSTPSYVVHNDGDITTNVPAGAGIENVIVVTPAGPSATTGADRFFYTKQGGLAIGLVPPGQKPATQAAVTAPSCGTIQVAIQVTKQLVSGNSHLTISSQGAAGLNAKLSSSTLPHDGTATLTLTSNGTDEGTGTYTITATNPATNPAVATLTVNYTTPIVAQDLYVTQGTEPEAINFGHSSSGGSYAAVESGVELVAGKMTVARLYVAPPSTALDGLRLPTSMPVSGLTAQLYGYTPSGQPLPDSPLHSPYGPLKSDGKARATLPYIGAGPVSDQELVSNANAYTFTLPDSWTQGTSDAFGHVVKTIKLLGRLVPSEGYVSSGACNSSDTFRLNDIPFTDTEPPAFASVVYPVALMNGNQLPASPDKLFADTVNMMPLPDGGLGPYLDGGAYAGTVNITSIVHGPCGVDVGACEYSRMLSILALLSQTYPDAAGFDEHVAAVGLPVEASQAANGVPGNYDVAFDDPSEHGGDAVFNDPFNLMHELGHEFGLEHASGACGADVNLATNTPGTFWVAWPPDQQGDGELEGIGLNTTVQPYAFIASGVQQGVAVGNPVDTPDAYDFMSYCAPALNGGPDSWISPINWAQLIANFATPADLGSEASVQGDIARAAGAAPTSAEGSLPMDSEVDAAQLSVTGFISEAGSSISVGPQVGPPDPVGSANDSFTLAARNASGTTIASVPMTAITGGHIDPIGRPDHTPPGQPASPFVQISGEVRAAGVASLQISDDGTVVVTRDKPAKAPRVTVLAPTRHLRVGNGRGVLVRWRASDPEHLALTVSIDDSVNDGRTWRTIYGGPNTGRVTLPSFYFTASTHARVRVVINDGWSDTTAVSPQFVALGSPPDVTIQTAFAKRMRVPGDGQIQLTGSALDQATQTLSGRQLKWYDGPFLLGTGVDLTAGPLPDGVNHLRLVARDPAGRTASATLTINVNPVRFRFVKLKIPKHASRTAHKLTLRGSAPLPLTVSIGRHHYRLTHKAKNLTFPISRGSTPLLLRVTVTSAGVSTPFAVRVTR
jgi:IPT/TIG domain